MLVRYLKSFRPVVFGIFAVLASWIFTPSASAITPQQYCEVLNARGGDAELLNMNSENQVVTGTTGTSGYAYNVEILTLKFCAHGNFYYTIETKSYQIHGCGGMIGGPCPNMSGCRGTGCNAMCGQSYCKNQFSGIAGG